MLIKLGYLIVAEVKRKLLVVNIEIKKKLFIINLKKLKQTKKTQNKINK